MTNPSIIFAIDTINTRFQNKGEWTSRLIKSLENLDHCMAISSQIHEMLDAAPRYSEKIHQTLLDFDNTLNNVPTKIIVELYQCDFVSDARGNLMVDYVTNSTDIGIRCYNELLDLFRGESK